MNVYDFDGVIYDGESTVDFFLFCLKKKPGLIKNLPQILNIAILHKRNKLSIDRLLEAANRITTGFIKNNVDFDLFAREFWKQHAKNLKPKFMSQLTDQDVIITASPYFLIQEILPELGVADTICSDIDVETGEFKYPNFGANKVRAFKQKYPHVQIEAFYTDSLSDTPMMEMAEQAFIVQGDTVSAKNACK